MLTHIDADHISGAIPLFTDDEVCDRFDDVWFNGWDQLRGFLSVAQGEAFSDLLGPGRPPVPLEPHGAGTARSRRS